MRANCRKAPPSRVCQPAWRPGAHSDSLSTLKRENARGGIIDPHVHQWNPLRTPRQVSAQARLLRAVHRASASRLEALLAPDVGGGSRRPARGAGGSAAAAGFRPLLPPCGLPPAHQRECFGVPAQRISDSQSTRAPAGLRVVARVRVARSARSSARRPAEFEPTPQSLCSPTGR